MDRNGIADMVFAQAAEVSGMPVALIGEDTTLDDLALDSLSAIELTVAIEDALDTTIDCGQRVSVMTLGCYVDMVWARAGGSMRLPMAA